MDPDDPEARIRELEVGSFSENPGIAPTPPPRPLRRRRRPMVRPHLRRTAQVSAPAHRTEPPSRCPPIQTTCAIGANVRRPRTRRSGWGVRLIVLAVFGLFMFTPLWNAVHTLFGQWWPSAGHSSSASAPLTVEKGGTLSVSGNNTSQTVACNDGTLTLGGNSNKFTVTGHCLTLHVSGNDTKVTVDSADTIDGGGIRTVTTYHSGMPKIVKTGIDVTVQQG